MLRFKPFYQPALWGGHRLSEVFGRALPEGLIGESWELVELPERHSEVADGPLAGQKLGDLWRRGALGGQAAGPFPFLLKWIDARQSLSVQVHPDEAACERLGQGRPKAEAWYVAEADPEPGGTLLIGHYPGLDAASLRQAVVGGTLKKWLYETRPRPGDIFLLDAGTIHAIGAGLLLLEVQQPSDTTFRIYDFGRVGADGRPRALHLDEAAVSIHYDRLMVPRPLRQGAQGPCFSMRPAALGDAVAAGPLRVFAATTKGARLTTDSGVEALAPGQVVVCQADDGPVALAEGEAVFVSDPS